MFIENLIQNIIIICFLAMLLRTSNRFIAGSLFFNSKLIIFEFIILIALFLATLNCNLKNFIVTLIFVIIIFGISYFFMPKDLPANETKYPLKSWIIFILSMISSLVFSTLFLSYY